MMITPDRLTSLFRPRRVALVGASDKSTFSLIAYRNLVEFGFADRTYLVNRRGADTHGQPTVTSCAQIGAPVDVAYLMVPQAGTLDALADAATAGIRNAVVLSSGYGAAGEAGRVAQAGPGETAARRGPWSEAAARRLLAAAGRAVLEGARGAAPADLDALAAVIARVGDLALALGEDLAALEVNPLRVDGPVIEALDALVTWKD